MYRSNETALRADMIPAASAAPQPARGYAAARSAAAARPLLALAAFRAGRHTRALQLSWVGLVRR